MIDAEPGFSNSPRLLARYRHKGDMGVIRQLDPKSPAFPAGPSSTDNRYR